MAPANDSRPGSDHHPGQNDQVEARQGITTAGLLPRPAGGPERIRASPAVSREHKTALLSRTQRHLFGSCHQILWDNLNNVDKSIKHPKDSKHFKESKHSKGSKDSKESEESKDSRDSKESKTIVEDARQPAEKPISLRPLEFEEAVKSLLQVKKTASHDSED